MLSWRKHYLYLNNNKSQIIDKIITSVELSQRAMVTEKPPTLKTKTRQHHRENGGRGALQNHMSKVLGDVGILRYLDCGEVFICIGQIS